MRNTATAGQLLGWAAIFLGAMAVVLAAFSSYDDLAWNLRAEARVARIAQGLSAVAAGVMFLLLGGLLETLLDLKDVALAEQQARREREGAAARQPVAAPGAAPGAAPRRYVHPPPDGAATPLPPRDEMVAQYGEEVGGRAWEAMEQARRNGLRIPADHAVAEARRDLGRMR